MPDPVHGLPAKTHLRFFREPKMAEKELQFSSGKQYLLSGPVLTHILL